MASNTHYPGDQRQDPSQYMVLFHINNLQLMFENWYYAAT
jgi:hypothetical protein